MGHVTTYDGKPLYTRTEGIYKWIGTMPHALALGIDPATLTPYRDTMGPFVPGTERERL